MSLPALAVFCLMGIVFQELFVRLRVLPDIRRVLEIAPAAARVIRSPTLSDDEKESEVRRMSLAVLVDTARFTGKIALVLGVCLALAWVGQIALAGVTGQGPLDLLTSWQALVVVVVVVALYARLRARG